MHSNPTVNWFGWRIFDLPGYISYM